MELLLPAKVVDVCLITATWVTDILSSLPVFVIKPECFPPSLWLSSNLTAIQIAHGYTATLLYTKTSKKRGGQINQLGWADFGQRSRSRL